MPAGSGGAGGRGAKLRPLRVQPNPHPIYPPALGICTEPLPGGCLCPLRAEPAPSVPTGATVPIPATLRRPDHLPNKSLGASGRCHQGSQQHEGPHPQPKEPVPCPDGTPGPLKSHQDGGPQLSPFPGPWEGSGWHRPRLGTAALPSPPLRRSRSWPNPSREPARAVGESPASRVRGGEVPKSHRPRRRLQLRAAGRKRVKLG